MNRVIITGTGRAGTSLLVWLLSELKLPTGYTETQCENILKTRCKAGLEMLSLRNYITKNPEFSLMIDKFIQEGYILDHVYVPCRNFYDAAQSRMLHGNSSGGLWKIRNPQEQENKLVEIYDKLIESLERNKIKYTIIEFPRYATDPEYSYKQLEFLMTKYDISYEKFLEVFNRISDPKLIHTFKEEK